MRGTLVFWRRPATAAMTVVLGTSWFGCIVDDGDERVGVVRQELTPFSPAVPFGIDGAATQEVVTDPATGAMVLSWRVNHDNPWVGGDYTLRASNDPNVLPTAKRGNEVWLWDFFDIEAGFDDIGGGIFLEPSVPSYRSVPVWPQVVDTWQGTGTRVPWEAHGLRLDPLGSAARVEPWEDDWQNPLVHWNQEDGFVHLSSKVRVVPVVSVVVYGEARVPGPEGGCCYPALGADRITEEDTRAFFDDQWTGERFLSSSPGYSPEQVVGAWYTKAGCENTSLCGKSPFTASTSVDGKVVRGGQFYQPDRLFDQCGVQFREIAHIKCRAPADVLHPSDVKCPSALQANSDAKKVRDWVTDVCMKDAPAALTDADAMKVVFMGRFNSSSGCSQGTIKGGNIPSTEWVFITDLADRATIPHEMGHALGLDHVAANAACSDPDNLMCPSPKPKPLGLHTLTAEQCKTVWERAEVIHNRYW